jgi:hypothetical protein
MFYYSRGLTLLKVLKMLRFLKYYLLFVRRYQQLQYNLQLCFFHLLSFHSIRLHYSGNRFYFQTRLNLIDPPLFLADSWNDKILQNEITNHLD